MIFAFLLVLATQTPLQRDAEALLDQQLTRIIDSYGDMAEALGRCSRVYPGGSAHPYVLKARQDVADIGADHLTTEAQRVESVLFAKAAQEQGNRPITVAECAAQIENSAEMVSTHVDGLRDLLSRLERQAAAR